MPLQGASQDASTDTNNAISLLLEQAGGKAGAYNITLKTYDDSTAAKGGWDDATCAKNANDHVANKAEVAVMGTYNSGCAKIEVPVLNQDPSGPMLMVSHANTNPGLTKAWDPGEPDKYYPTGVRNYGRIIATDDFQGQADAEFAKQDLKVTKCVVLERRTDLRRRRCHRLQERGQEAGHRDRRRRGMGCEAAELHRVVRGLQGPQAPTACSSAASTTTTVSS